MFRTASFTRLYRTVYSTFLIILSLSSLAAFADVGTPATIPVSVDPRVELLGVIFHLAGNPEYNMGKIPSYEEDIAKSFGAFKNHPAVVIAGELHKQKGISYDAVMSLALYVTDPPELSERMDFDPLPSTLDERWSTADARRFLVAARDFAVKAHFMEFFNKHSGLYSLTRNRMEIALRSEDLAAWCKGYFGIASGADFHLELGMLNGGASYGPRVSIPGQPTEFHSVLGVWQIDSAGMPEFSLDVLKTVVHEFLHSFVNPLTAAHQSELAPAGRKLFASVEPIMAGLAYGSWQTVLNESLVRAITIRWVAAQTDQDQASQAVVFQQKMGFYWIDGLNNLLVQYEGNRANYPVFADYLPTIKSYLDDYAAHVDERIDAVEAGWTADRKARRAKAPHVVAMDPPNGSEDVDPATTVLSFTFDRPMLDKHWSVMDIGKPMPRITGDVHFDSDRRVFSIPVALEPGQAYEFTLNKVDGGAFRDEQGNQLLEYVVRFSTKNRED